MGPIKTRYEYGIEDTILYERGIEDNPRRAGQVDGLNAKAANNRKAVEKTDKSDQGLKNAMKNKKIE